MQKRIDLLDAWRSLCVLLMIVYHAFYDLSLFGAVSGELMSGMLFETLKYAASGGFILISGAVSRRSRSCLRRGFYVFCWGFAVSLVMAVMRLNVAFGILQLIGFAMIICGILGERLYKASEMPWFPICCGMLFALFSVMLPKISVSCHWLYPLGLKYEGFYSADFYPLLPWIFLYFLGVWLGGIIEKNKAHSIWSKALPKALTLPGRHSLKIYILHQPVLYGLCLLIFGGK